MKGPDKARGIKTFGATLIPRHNNQQIPWDAAKTAQRNALNEWIRLCLAR